MRHPAAFINVIAERRSFKEAITHLQATWDELCDSKVSIYKDGLDAARDALLTKRDDYRSRFPVRKYGGAAEYENAILDCIAVIETLIKDASKL